MELELTCTWSREWYIPSDSLPYRAREGDEEELKTHVEGDKLSPVKVAMKDKQEFEVEAAATHEGNKQESWEVLFKVRWVVYPGG